MCNAVTFGPRTRAAQVQLGFAFLKRFTRFCVWHPTLGCDQHRKQVKKTIEREKPRNKEGEKEDEEMDRPQLLYLRLHKGMNRA